MDPILIGGVIFAFVLAVGLVAAATRRSKATGHLRVLGVVFLLTVAAFCIFGFLASFELTTAVGIRIVYSLLGLSSVLGAYALVTHRTKSVIALRSALHRRTSDQGLTGLESAARLVQSGRRTRSSSMG
jgi:hypothetical protein